MSRMLTLEKSFEDYAAEADALFDIHGRDAWRYYDFIPSQAVMARPQGGCFKLRTAATGKQSYDYGDSGEFCWPSRADIRAQEQEEKRQAVYKARPELFTPGSEASMNIFEAFYGPKRESLSIENFDDMQLSGFFGGLKRAFTPPRAFRKVYKKALRYGGAYAVGAFMPAGARKKMFGLSTKESSQFEKVAKVQRGLAAAVAVVATGGAALTAMKGAALAKGALGAAAAAKAAKGASAGGDTWGHTAADYGASLTPEAAAAQEALTPGQSLITKAGGEIWNFTKGLGQNAILQKFAAAQIPNTQAIPAGGITYDPGYDDRPGAATLPAKPAGGDFQAVASEPSLDEDALLKDSLKPSDEASTPMTATPLVLIGLGLAALAMLRRKA